MPEAAGFDHPTYVDCPGGPRLVRGDVVVPGPDGTDHRSPRPVTAVCRCGHSGELPWCDGTHKRLAEDARPD